MNDTIRKMTDDAVRAAMAAAPPSEKYAVVVIVRQLPFAGMPVNVGSNITSGARDTIRIMKEGISAVQTSIGGKVS